MEIEDQVCSLELAKRLKELNVKQKSLFFWVNPELTVDNVTQLLNEDERFIDHHPDLYFSAFTSVELSDILPGILKNEYYLTSERLSEKHHYRTEYKHWNGKDSFCHPNCFEYTFPDTEAEKEADSRARMLIYLIENGLIDNDA